MVKNLAFSYEHNTFFFKNLEDHLMGSIEVVINEGGLK